MGYRQYILRIEKEKVNEIRHLSLQELKEKFKGIGDVVEYDDYSPAGYLSIHELFKAMGVERLFELGKYFDAETEQNITEAPLFTSKDMQDEYSDYGIALLNESAFLTIANHFESNVKNHFELLLTDKFMIDEFEEDPWEANPIVDGLSFADADKILENKYVTKRIILDFISKKRKWDRDIVLNKDKEHPSLSRSLLYEYEVFDMLRLYKESDYEKYAYILYGY